MFLFFLVVAGGFALYVMNPEERTRLLRKVVSAARFATNAAVEMHTAPDPFHDALRVRTPWPIVTPALLVIYIAVFVRMIFAEGALADPQTLISWGGSFGPRTTNGEWWRLVTATFVHAGPLHLLADMAGLALAGVLLERLLGHAAFLVAYLAAGIFAGVATLSADPMAVTVGASGAIVGLYGVLLATTIWSLIFRSAFTPSIEAAKRLAPGAVVFILYYAASGAATGTTLLNGLVMGVVCGAVLAKGIGERTTPLLRSGAAFASVLIIVSASAVPIRGFTDVKPEIERVVAFEARTATVYDAAVEQFRLGGVTAEKLAHLIESTILPELQAAQARLTALDRVPAQHQALIAGASEYLRLRRDSWKLRAEGLQQHNLPTLQKADRTERASLDVLETIKPYEQQ